MVGIALLSSGSANRRLMMMSVPMVYAAEPEAPVPPEPDISISRVDIMPEVGDEMRIEVLSPKAQPSVELGGPEPRILIYHTHATEAYAEAEDNDWRTQDQSENIIAVGELLAKILREQYGCNVIHDKTNHEPPVLATSYSRSEVTMKRYKQTYPSLTLFIDVHRDAGAGLATEIGGERVARMMFVVGTGEGATGKGYKEMPDFESNYALALAVTNKLAEIDNELPRNIRVKVGRYNQHVSNQCLLLEVGDNKNTLQEALNAVPYFAQALMEVVGNGAPIADPGKAASAAANASGKAPTPAPEINWAP
ncbi:MAG TPA: stage II sporulation protein P [Feifaniaceae bacterium]|nr:stage II sporulation protein P [Feifaniaceae bacterium]